MNTQNVFLKRIVLATMVIAFVANNAQAMETAANNTEVVAKQEQTAPKGPAAKKYDEFRRRWDKVTDYSHKIWPKAFAGAIVGCTIRAIPSNKALMLSNALINVGMVIGLASLHLGLWLDIREEDLLDKMMVEKEAQEKALAA